MAGNLVALGLWRNVLVASVRRPGPDLTARQFALLLTVYLVDPPHTVRGLAAALNVSKPVITRALDRLSVLGYIRRKRDADDKRNVLVQRTVKGSVYLSEFAQLVIDAGAVAPTDLAALMAAQMTAPPDETVPAPPASEPADESMAAVADASGDAPAEAGVMASLA